MDHPLVKLDHDFTVQPGKLPVNAEAGHMVGKKILCVESIIHYPLRLLK